MKTLYLEQEVSLREVHCIHSIRAEAIPSGKRWTVILHGRCGGEKSGRGETKFTSARKAESNMNGYPSEMVIRIYSSPEHCQSASQLNTQK